MNNPDKPLRDYATFKTVIHGPYAEGETAQDRALRLEQEEDRRTSALIWWVLWTMLGLICAFVVYWSFLR